MSVRVVPRGTLRGAAALGVPVVGACLALLGLVGCRLDADDWAAVKTGIRTRYPDVPTLTPAQLETWLARGDTAQPVLLDVRAPAEFAVSHLQGAHLTPDVEAALRVLAAAPADTPVVTYCSVGYRSAGIAELLRRRGFTGVANLEGSLFAWANEGRPLWRGAAQVEVVHPYGRPWSGLLDSTRHASKALIDSLTR